MIIWREKRIRRSGNSQFGLARAQTDKHDEREGCKMRLMCDMVVDTAMDSRIDIRE